jgi:hypothetical protein
MINKPASVRARLLNKANFLLKGALLFQLLQQKLID